MNTDAQLQANVLAQLQWWPSIDAAHIGVTAKQGVVVLTGQVSHYAEKAAAEEAVKAIYGVRGLANDIVVETANSDLRTDQDIAEAALSALKWHFKEPHDQIHVVVKHGWVTQEGTVDWDVQRIAAANCVHYLMGVAAVTNRIVVKPTATWTDVTQKIEEAFRRHASLDARRITVTTKDDEGRRRTAESGSAAVWRHGLSATRP